LSSRAPLINFEPPKEVIDTCCEKIGKELMGAKKPDWNEVDRYIDILARAHIRGNEEAVCEEVALQNELDEIDAALRRETNERLAQRYRAQKKRRSCVIL
jgi:hypothetical protein